MKKQTEKFYKIATIGFLVLSMGIILFPIQRTPTVDQVAFIRNSAQLTVTQTHGAASQWDYLFEDTSTKTNDTKTYGGQMGTNSTVPNNTSPYPDKTNGPTTTNTTTPPLQTTNTGGTYGGSLGTTNTATTTTNAVTTTTTAAKDCTTPRGQTVTDKDFVLAYEQRTDVTTMCNVERRICNNGILEGSYVQNSCKEDVNYDYTKVDVVSYNQPVVNPLVQPGQASNAGGDFGTNGQVNQNKQPTNMRGTTNTAGTTTSTAVDQTTTYKQNCSTPRGTTVNHGQFVKAYKTSVGLLDMPCETQLRLCVNGTLKGNFMNKSCTFKNMTYNDYIAGNTDFTTPTPQDIQGTLTPQDNSKNYGIWDWIKGVFTRY
ncbi:MAG: hypothetical protein NTX91_03220 [candidate division SR1 bacterium]|nr:hypothetical protein [candidate division SR1 bacterium]